jgi:2-polyprenyl-3-methyl-5-hydroxy-6-metoxy-1,4-benzoquinol methylase
MELDQRELIKLAYELILGRKPATEAVVDNLFREPFSLSQLSSDLLSHPELRRIFEIRKIFEFIYSNEAEEKVYRKHFDQTLQLPTEQERHIIELIAKFGDPYTLHHRHRFADQLRALVKVRSGILPDVTPLRVLDVGVMAISGMYGKIADGLELHTCDHPAREAQQAAISSTRKFYPVNLETEPLASKFPEIKGKFHLIFFCEVLEHIRVTPTEILLDLKELLAPNGLIYMSTPNGMRPGVFLDYFQGRSPVVHYSRQFKRQHDEGFVHVREHTIKELIEGLAAAGLKVRARAIKEYFQPESLWHTSFVSAGSVISVLAERAS